MPSKLVLLVYAQGLVVVVGNPQDMTPWVRADLGPLLSTVRLNRDDLGEDLFFALLHKYGELPIQAVAS